MKAGSNNLMGAQFLNQTGRGRSGSSRPRPVDERRTTAGWSWRGRSSLIAVGLALVVGACLFDGVIVAAASAAEPVGTITSYTDPGINFPGPIVAGPDGALWFANEDSATIERVTTGGSFTTYPSPITPRGSRSDRTARCGLTLPGPRSGGSRRAVP
jgi:hypothetical protein